jgi:NADH-quinone oxidoreductase subunit J
MIEMVFLSVFALGAVAGAVGMLLLRHPMRVALALIGTMLSLAAIYAQLGLHVIAVFQVLVYVGAVMVFMVYAIMLLDTRDRSFTERFSPLAAAGVAGLVLLGGVLLAGAFGSAPLTATTPPDEGLFTIGVFARIFMDQYWLYFALTAVLLLVAEIAASAVLEVRRKAAALAAAVPAPLGGTLAAPAPGALDTSAAPAAIPAAEDAHG